VKKLVGSIGIALAFISSGDATLAQETAERFVVAEGKMQGIEVPPDVTLLIDTQTGRTWALFAVEGSPQWIPIPFSDEIPTGSLPPLLGN
jgi:hypothetical protein